jgi:hypothetical protein
VPFVCAVLVMHQQFLELAHVLFGAADVVTDILFTMQLNC